jgi:heme-degrading monooxygenase HmoA
MFARSVTVRLKPNSVAEFNRTMEKEILPLLQKQKGFQDEISLVASNGSEAVGISLWDQKDDAEAYNRATYPEVQKLLAKVSEGTPQVQTYEVGTSTIQKAAAEVGSSKAATYAV